MLVHQFLQKDMRVDQSNYFCLGTMIMILEREWADSSQNRNCGIISLKKIQDAYAVFDTGETKISQNLFAPFSILEGIGQVRHCFAHRGGIVDQRALKAIQRVPGLENANIGDRIPLQGRLLETLSTH
jgi:hypothetical protein